MKQSTKKRILLRCCRCGWEWHQRGENKPGNCPHCNSPYYDKPRVRGVFA